MIVIEKTAVSGLEAAIRGMRNPKNSWDQSDSEFGRYTSENDVVGPKDLRLMQTLAEAGTDHGKCLRMIHVSCDITAPLYWVAEHDTYKVGTTRNSCSFMHKGVAKPFDIHDFSITDNRVYDVLSPLPGNEHTLEYPYETEEFRTYECSNGRKYDVYRNGRIFAQEFTVTEASGRSRVFKRRECKPTSSGNYASIALGGRGGEQWLLHRLVATVWIPNPDELETVNHKNGKKGDNSAENLEWSSRAENIQKGFDEGLYANVTSLHARYKKWKAAMSILPVYKRTELLRDFRFKNLSLAELAMKYHIKIVQVENIVTNPNVQNGLDELFILCYHYDKLIKELNRLHDIYLDTLDEEVFQQIRGLLPSGYNQRYTWDADYQVLQNIYHARKNHRLPEWHTFCEWIENLPYSEIITGKKVTQ